MCACVHMYIHTFWSHLGMSICDHARNVNLPLRSGTRVSHITQGSQWRTELGGQCFLAMEDEQDSTAEPLQCTYLAKSSAETSAEHRDQEENKKEF